MDYTIWFILGLLLMVTELILPTFIMLWFGLAALVMGFLSAYVPGLDIYQQIFIFAALALAFVFAWKMGLQKLVDKSPEEVSSQRMQELLGTVHRLSHPIQNSRGRLQISGISWLVECEEDAVAAGRYVRIIHFHGAKLVVEPYHDEPPANPPKKLV